jgi:glycerol kinase
MPTYIMALDQGTTSSRAMLFDHQGHTRASASQEFKQHYPQPGWVEHDATEIWQSQLAVAEKVLADAKVGPQDLAALGITNQRETVVLWERATGKPLHNAIVWQCRRTAPLCDRIRAEGFDRTLRDKTGLVTDAYFSGTKIAWLLENLPGARERAERGELACGTIDTWLIWQLTRGRVHATDVSNASRTLLFNLRTLAWDNEILNYFRIPASLLPEVKSSSEVFGETSLFGAPLRIAGVAGDQQASLFGQQCFGRGMVKNTYGTGCFLLMNTGAGIPRSESGLLGTVAWGRQGRTVYALEGSVFIAGAAIQWLRDEMKLIRDAAESETRRAPCPTRMACTLFPPSWVWARRTGTLTRAGRLPASPAGRTATTWCARRWSPSLTRPGASWTPWLRIRNCARRCSAWMAARRATISSASSRPISWESRWNARRQRNPRRWGPRIWQDSPPDSGKTSRSLPRNCNWAAALSPRWMCRAARNCTPAGSAR